MRKDPAILRKPSVSNGRGQWTLFWKYILRKSWIWKLVIKVQSECIFGHLHSLLSAAVLVLNHWTCPESQAHDFTFGSEPGSTHGANLGVSI